MNRAFSRVGLIGRALVLATALLSASAPAYAQGVQAKITTELQGYYAGANALGTPALSFDQLQTLNLAPGTGTGKADKAFIQQRTLTASSAEDLDLAGTLTDQFGATLTFVKVKAIYVHAAAANTNNVVMGNAASNGFLGPLGALAHTAAVVPGGWQVFINPTGWTVTAGTGDLLHIANSSSGTSVTYDIIVIGTSS